MVNTAKVTREFPLSRMASAAKEALGKAMRSSSLSIALGAVACIMLWAWIITGTHPVRAIVAIAAFAAQSAVLCCIDIKEKGGEL